ncbi:sensor domain-containing diguanylate cyclase [Comamonas sp. CMM02]|uniref:GGDEF domain-containing protein n=1 Tax=Comamonas sp. CMM02 TaxID=2769307 RepID=UPI00177AD314|nr:sensor domain-containing diguanylate cyclase [Comamonas sp. CMM02]MBD9400247.1 sensor domain-containing diguanylate cyclase [Comamonas sp. CMM02]
MFTETQLLHLPHDNDGVYRTLLESTKAIPWKIDWATKRYVYVGPQIEALLGWSVGTWVTVQDWADRIHPEDREQVVKHCVELSIAGVDHEADYRALTADQRYVWMRDTVHVLRNAQGETEALIGFMFDISERKITEEKLLSLQRELEVMSYKDGLTNIANRRRFDDAMAQYWERAMQTQHPLSLMVLDIDFFKQYNDYYGHVRGDQCLIDIAQMLAQTLDGPSDLVARFGGEEFVVLLPEVPAHIAHQVAERFMRQLKEHPIPHPGSPHGQRVTASIGVGTIVPQSGTQSIDFIEAVDQQLYLAKKQGRNRVVSQNIELSRPAFFAGDATAPGPVLTTAAQSWRQR